jgi:hypothetical protein
MNEMRYLTKVVSRQKLFIRVDVNLLGIEFELP